MPYATASPAELREAILPEDREQFDAGYRAALDAAAQTLSLDELEAWLSHWRRIAWSVSWKGPDAWRALLAEAERRLAGGEPPPGTRPWEEVKADLGL